MYPNKLLAKPLSKEDQESLIKAFKQVLVGLPGIRALYLIGSASRLEMTDASDLDFVAIFDTHLERENSKKLFYNNPRPVDWPSDVLWYLQDEFERRANLGGICQVTRDDGIRLYPDTLARES